VTTTGKWPIDVTTNQAQPCCRRTLNEAPKLDNAFEMFMIPILTCFSQNACRAQFTNELAIIFDSVTRHSLYGKLRVKLNEMQSSELYKF